MGKPEGSVEDYLIKKTKEFGYMQRKLVSPSKAGFPDRLVVGNGYTIFIELKSNVGKPSEAQKRTIRQLRQNGAIALIINSKEDCLALLQHIQAKTVHEFKPTCKYNYFDQTESE